MPLRRVLVECAVLSLQDSCVLYPYCKGCFSRIDTDSADTRLYCSKCGYSCARSLLDYRYRLSLRVARGSSLFGVTVFGNSLNQFFGIHASGLQRLVEDKTGPSEALSKSTLLVKAVEECFIGKHFIFGIKVTDSDNEPWVGRSTSSNSMAQLIATQMILPKPAGLRGCTVLIYFEAILQKAAEAKLSTTDAFKYAKLQREALWPVPDNSQTSEFTDEKFCSSDFLPLPLSRPHRLDSSLSPTPPWQQTLGLITSSAEQEERSQDDTNNPPFMEKDVQSSTPAKAWLGLSPTPHKTTRLTLPVMDFTTPDITKSILTACQEEYPLSESLTEFLKAKNTQDKLSLELADHVKCVDKSQVDTSQANYVCNKHNETKIVSSIEPNEGSEDEQSESGAYNCSADLFSNSPRMDLSPAAFGNSPFQDVCFPLPTFKGLIHKQPVDTYSKPLSEKADLFLTPTNQKAEQGKHSLRKSFQLGTSFDFIPVSQSTPAEKGNCVQSNLRTKYVRKCTKENILNGGNQATHHFCVTPTSRCKKTNKRGDGLCLNSRIHKRRSSSVGNNNRDSILIVPPTPADHHKTLFKPESKFDCKLYECAVEENELCSNADEDCDWSRDLFSDSV
ncbi:DNA damage-induced apoptosis suppressor protein [Periophthalmus magnuspinnatus]|uniref:DNA damage-induced apoptosis suppressor protein n=1 Tax=Periophthalmus magnuspinnatus TaxID=409849 RepID=UPI00145B49ED|nr:DNA damage-induced apoptosis suppressor protein [Periophthalmus magnuspinnatus]